MEVARPILVMEQLGHAQAHVWLAFCENLPEAWLVGACTPLLDPEERRRWGRLRLSADRHQYLAAHALLRVALSRYADVAPQEWRLRPGAAGKPEIAGPAAAPPLRFSLSHTRGLAACIVALERDVGVDVEAMGSGAEVAEAAEQFLAPAERAACDALPPGARRERLYEYWTLKEAYVKGCGRGLSLPLRGIAFEIDASRRIRVALGAGIGDSGEDWQFLLSEPSPAHKLAAAVRRRRGEAVAIVERLLALKDLTAHLE
ncbi:MAG TPA: 4'-phosphopantetheinyl transferase superfamily protein [Planctomycetota bacterium]|nr:4'-phosphopantetheinyl transferase superfamily protein [Planctomycetota bacterium]